jgi:hypothetical protein
MEHAHKQHQKEIFQVVPSLLAVFGGLLLF